MLENIEEMQRRHEREIEKLQRFCKHKNTHRSRYAWAIGHFSNDVEVCDHCGKIIKTYDTATPLGGEIKFNTEA